MKIAFYTSTLGDRPFDEVVEFAKTEGFDAVEIDVRSHIARPEDLAGVVKTARDAGLAVSSVTMFGNQNDPDETVRAARRAETKAFAVEAAKAGVPVFVLFAGRNPNASEDENYESFASFARDVLAATKDSPIKIVSENWPGPDRNFIATTPAGWRKLFTLVPDPRLGIEFDPSHLIWQGIDPYPVRAEFKNRIFILHGKDTSIDKVAVQSAGYFVPGWWRYVLPGRGLIDWKRFIGEARKDGFDGVISIEHEDRDFGWPKGDLAARLEGHRLAKKHLAESIG